MFLENYLHPEKSDNVRDISVQGLAHVGDAVYELMVRTWLCETGASSAKNLHSRAVTFVSAKAQAAAVKKVMSFLDESEVAVFKRGRNAHVNSVPKGSTHEEYHAATGLEALFGFLYLSGCTERLNELFALIVCD